MTPVFLTFVIRNLLRDSRPFEIQLTDYTSASQAGAKLAVRSIAANVRAMYRQLGGQDVVATTEERDGSLVLMLRPMDEPGEEIL